VPAATVVTVFASGGVIQLDVADTFVMCQQCAE